MPDSLVIFGLQFALSLFVVALLARWYLAPWLAGMALEDALVPLLIPHAFRYVGLVFLVPGVTAASLPPGFAGPAAWGDVASGLLAILALVALRARWRIAVALVWLFGVFGTADLLYAVARGLAAGAQRDLGAAWYIPTFFVPVLLVTHAMIFTRLLQSRRQG